MPFTRLFQFSPRAGREEYSLINLAVQAVSLGLYMGQGLFSMGSFSGLKIVLALAAGLIVLVISLALLWISLAAGFRRMHDLNMPGWWFIAYLAAITMGSVALSGIWWVFTLFGVGLVLFLCLKKPADQEPNRFGPAAGAFLPGLFSHRGVFAAVVAAGILISLVQVGISRVQLNQVKMQLPYAGQSF